MIFRHNKQHKPGRKIAAIFYLIFFLLFIGVEKSQAQSSPTGASCILVGADTVTAGSTVTYTLSPCSAGKWTVSCGTVTDQTPTSVTINFAVTSCSNAVISVSGTPIPVSKRVTINQAAALDGGAISNISQTVNYHNPAGLLMASLATGGICDGAYTYQWFYSTDKVNFSSIPGAIGQNCQPEPPILTTYYKRQVRCTDDTSFTTNIATVTVYPALSTLSLSPVTQSIAYNETAASITLSEFNGGDGKFTYLWQSSPNNDFTGAAVIGGATSSSYNPGTPSSTTYFRAAVISNGDTTYSSAAVVNAFPPVHAGSVSPSSQIIGYDSIPVQLSSIGANGGDGRYIYQWFSSTDGGTTWSLIDGVATPGYTPANLTETTYYRVVVTSNGISDTGSPGVVKVNPKP